MTDDTLERVIGKAIDKVAAAFDEHIEAAMVSADDMLRRHRASPTEIREFMDRYRVEQSEWKAKTLADVRKWFERGCVGGLQLH